MLPFYVLIMIPVLYYFAPVKFKGRDKNAGVFKLFVLLLFLLMALRHYLVGNDTFAYMSLFERARDLSWQDLMSIEWEPGFLILSKLITYVTSDAQVYLTIISFLIILPILSIYSRETELPLLSISLFLVLPTFTMMFSGLRQALAVSIGLLVYEATKHKKLVLSLLLALLAVCFHKSAFVLFALYPIYHLKTSKKAIPIVATIFILVFAFNRPIFKALEVLLGDIYSSTSQDTGAYTMLILFILFAAFSFLIPDESELDREAVGLRNLLILACLLQCFAPIHYLAMRMNYYFIIFIPLLIPKVIVSCSGRWRQVATVSNVIMTVFFIAFFVIRATTGNVNLTVFPYHFFWENINI